MKPWENQKGIPLEIEKSPFLYLPRIRYMRIVDEGLEIGNYCQSLLIMVREILCS